MRLRNVKNARGIVDNSSFVVHEPKEFKVLVLLHGFSGDCNDYLTFSNVVRYAEKHNLAIIMPSGCNSGYTDDLEGAKYHSFIAYEF